MAGWIKLHRGLTENWLWKDKEPFDKRSAWIDLLLMANHTDFKVRRNNHIVVRKRGEVNTSVMYLSEKWRWSRNKVYRFLELLKEDKMIQVIGTTDGTTITIENYEKYQISETTDETTDGTPHGTTDGTTDGTHDKNVKECIKNDKEKRGRFTPPTLEEVRAYISEKDYHINAQQFIDFYASKNWMVGKNKMKDWKASVRTWEQRRKDQERSKPKQQSSRRELFARLIEEHGNDI